MGILTMSEVLPNHGRDPAFPESFRRRRA